MEGEYVATESANIGREGPAGQAYVFGHSDHELERLSTQARLIDPITRRFFIDAGIGPGMRVLDVGSGAGDTAFLVASLVGDSGEVVELDRAPKALARARSRAEERSLRNVSFVEGEPGETAFGQPFDAVVGRYVLMFQPDPAATLRKGAAYAQAGGTVVFHELDWDGARSLPSVPAYDECCRSIADTVRQAGADPRMGARFPSTFGAAGLPEPSMRLEAVLGTGTANDVVRLTVDVARTLASETDRPGGAGAGGLDIDTLAERIANEATASGSVIIGRSEIGAWARV